MGILPQQRDSPQQIYGNLHNFLKIEMVLSTPSDLKTHRPCSCPVVLSLLLSGGPNPLPPPTLPDPHSHPLPFPPQLWEPREICVKSALRVDNKRLALQNFYTARPGGGEEGSGREGCNPLLCNCKSGRSAQRTAGLQDTWVRPPDPTP